MEQRRFTPAEDLAYQIQAKLDYLSELKLTLEVRLRDVTKGALVFGLVWGIFELSFVCVTTPRRALFCFDVSKLFCRGEGQSGREMVGWWRGAVDNGSCGCLDSLKTKPLI